MHYAVDVLPVSCIIVIFRSVVIYHQAVLRVRSLTSLARCPTLFPCIMYQKYGFYWNLLSFAYCIILVPFLIHQNCELLKNVLMIFLTVVFFDVKRINFGLHDVSDDFKPNCHTTWCQIITTIFLFLLCEGHREEIKGIIILFCDFIHF